MWKQDDLISQHSTGGSGQSSRWIWRQRLRMASLVWTSSSVKGDLDVVVSMEEMAKGCSKTRGRSFLGQEVAWYYLCIIYFNWSRCSVSIHVLIDTWHLRMMTFMTSAPKYMEVQPANGSLSCSLHFFLLVALL